MRPDAASAERDKPSPISWNCLGVPEERSESSSALLENDVPVFFKGLENIRRGRDGRDAQYRGRRAYGLATGTMGGVNEGQALASLVDVAGAGTRGMRLPLDGAVEPGAVALVGLIDGSAEP